MGFKYEERFDLSRPPAEVWAVLPEVVAECSFELRESSDERRSLRARKRMKNVSEANVPIGTGPSRATAPTKKTWGEKLAVDVDAPADGRGGGARVRIESRLVFGLIDWGENRRNVERVRAALVDRLAHTA